MAKSRFEYVRDYELDDTLLPKTFLIVRLDGKSFHRFSDLHSFTKPNDKRALDLMNDAAKQVMMKTEVGRDVRLAFGESDEMSFLVGRNSSVYRRRASKILTTFVSAFTSFYIRLWSQYFPDSPLDPYSDVGPSFDGRIVQYPTATEVMDYFKWRQADTHINNLYNTCFWALVLQSNNSTVEANKRLQGTVSSQKNELLFNEFNINYNNIDPIYRKGSILLWSDTDLSESDDRRVTQPELEKDKTRSKKYVKICHEDLISSTWWTSRPTLLS